MGAMPMTRGGLLPITSAPHRERAAVRAGRDAPTMQVLALGLLAGAAGVAAMTLAEKVEQAVTGRPDSYVPAHTLERLLGLPAKPDRDRLGLNWAMHWGQGIVLGPVRAWMAKRGIGGPFGSFLFLNLRLLNDQSLENATGVGAPALDVAARRAGDRRRAQGGLRLRHRRRGRPAHGRFGRGRQEEGRALLGVSRRGRSRAPAPRPASRPSTSSTTKPCGAGRARVLPNSAQAPRA
jgi:hypothetical protein